MAHTKLNISLGKQALHVPFLHKPSPSAVDLLLLSCPNFCMVHPSNFHSLVNTSAVPFVHFYLDLASKYLDDQDMLFL